MKIGEYEGLPSFAIGASAWHSDVSGLGTSNNAAVFALVKVPLTEAWKASHESAAAREKQRAAELRLGDTRRLVDQEASKAWDDLDAAWTASQVADAGAAQVDQRLAAGDHVLPGVGLPRAHAGLVPLAAVGAGIHAQRAADAADPDAVCEQEPAEQRRIGRDAARPRPRSIKRIGEVDRGKQSVRQQGQTAQCRDLKN